LSKEPEFVNPFYLPKPKEKKQKRMSYAAYSKKDKDMTEAEIQELAHELCDRLGLMYLHLPEKITKAIQRDQRAVKMLSGQPDLLLYRHGENPCRMLWLELKRVHRKGEPNEGLEQSQVKWWRAKGLKPLVCYGWEETKKAITEYYSGYTNKSPKR